MHCQCDIRSWRRIRRRRRRRKEGQSEGHASCLYEEEPYDCYQETVCQQKRRFAGFYGSQIRPGFLKCPTPLAWLWAICMCRMYIKWVNMINLCVPIQTACAMAKKTALLDSGATENFISYNTWKQLGIWRQELDEPIMVHNVDGTENKKGKIIHYCWLQVLYNG